MTTEALIAQPDSQAIVPYAPAPMPVPWSDWGGMVEFAKTAAAAGNVMPKHVISWQAAIMIMQKGVELRIPPLEALTGIYLVEGKVTLSAKLMLALVVRAHGGRAIVVEETTDKRCVLNYARRDGDRTRRTYEYTIEKATQAGLTAKDVWKRYPENMIRARAISNVVNMTFPDVVAGLTPEELDLPVRVTADGDVILDSDALAAEQGQRARNVTPAAAAIPSVALADPPASLDQITAVHRIWQRLQRYDPAAALPDLKGVTDAGARRIIAEMTATGTRLKAAADARDAAPPTDAECNELLDLASTLHAAGLDVPGWDDDLTYAGWQKIMATLTQIRDEHDAKRAAAPPAPALTPEQTTGQDGDDFDSEIPY